MFNRIGCALLVLLALAGCSRAEPVNPALWHVKGPKGEQAWLFGTIHALPGAVEWRTAKVDAALRAADRLVLEVAAVDDDARTAQAFAALARSPDLPPLDQRVPADLRDELAAELQQAGMASNALDPFETWAAALMLQNSADDAQDSSNGIDRALVRAWTGPIDEFEGAAAQLRLFDGLDEADQRALLDDVLIEGDRRTVQLAELQSAWMRGDMDLIARVTDDDLGRHPNLRAVLLVNRNRDWVGKLEAMLAGGARPFVAVGAAHLAGADGLPALLAARGWQVTRLQ